jgi:hypothetical protein
LKSRNARTGIGWELTADPISTRVNQPANNERSLIEPAG